MNGLYLEDGLMSFRDDLPLPVLRTDEVLLGVSRAGICGTDLALLSGYAGFSGVPGHEFVGVVLAGPAAWLGARVTAEINIACGDCEYCRRGQSNHCEQREVVGIRDHQGAFAEQLALPVANLWRIPPALTDEQAVLVEPLAAALRVLEQVDIKRGGRTLVIGAGRLAQLLVQVLLHEHTSLDVLVRNPARRRSFAGLAAECIDQPAGSYDLVVEASGSEAGLALALGAVRPGGTIVLKSTYTGIPPVDLSAVVVNEVSLVGSRCGPFDQALDWLAAGKIDLSQLRFETFPLAAFEEALARARDPHVYKVLFEP